MGFALGEDFSEKHRAGQVTRPTRISCLATLDAATCAAFLKESRMEHANVTNANRKSEPSLGDRGICLGYDRGVYGCSCL
jgi:hypothetical protein